MKPKLTVAGSLNMDLIVRSPRIPLPGETIIGSEFKTVPGGKGANQLVAVARAGAQVAHIGRVGDDAFVGVLTVALAKGKSMIEAVRWGNAAGALAATGIGAQTSLPMRDELDRFIAEHYL